jgi:hypothetical protein
MLARLLKADFLPTVWIPGEKERYVRELLAHRLRLVRSRTAVINELHAVYAKRNIEVPGMIWQGLDARRLWPPIIGMLLYVFEVTAGQQISAICGRDGGLSISASEWC